MLFAALTLAALPMEWLDIGAIVLYFAAVAAVGSWVNILLHHRAIYYSLTTSCIQLSAFLKHTLEML